MILASQSPRRQELLQKITTDFTVQPADIDETRQLAETPHDYVLRMAVEKASALTKSYPQELILACDTVVTLGDIVLGKPHTEKVAYEMLTQLSGKEHHVLTSVCLKQGTRQMTTVVDCAVTFYPLTEEEINTYIATGETLDKAGAYGIQGQGALLIEKIYGDYYAVMGLPVAKVYRMLQAFTQA